MRIRRPLKIKVGNSEVKNEENLYRKNSVRGNGMPVLGKRLR